MLGGSNRSGRRRASQREVRPASSTDTLTSDDDNGRQEMDWDPLRPSDVAVAAAAAEEDVASADSDADSATPPTQGVSGYGLLNFNTASALVSLIGLFSPLSSDGPPSESDAHHDSAATSGSDEPTTTTEADADTGGGDYEPDDDDDNDGDYEPTDGEDYEGDDDDEYAVPPSFLSRTLSRRRLSQNTVEKSLRATKELRAQCAAKGLALLGTGEIVQLRDSIGLQSMVSAWRSGCALPPSAVNCACASPQRSPHEPESGGGAGSCKARQRRLSNYKQQQQSAAAARRDSTGQDDRLPNASPQAPLALNAPPKGISAVSLLRAREIAGLPGQRIAAADAFPRYIPNSCGKPVLLYNARPYSGQFSRDGQFFYSCTQDFCVHLYDSSDPYHLTKYKTVRAPTGQWTITDACLSHDNSFMVYSSISPFVYLTQTDAGTHTQHTLNLSSLPGQRSNSRNFGVWSVRLSADDRELVAGTSSKCVYVYDIERGAVVLAVRGHCDDVNAVCFGDESTNLLYSGSDDSLIKVWDRRSLGASAKPAGVLPGHTEGVTYISARGDGRYLVSNAKDQSAKLWDVRRMVEPGAFDAWPTDQRDLRVDWDYRYQAYPLGAAGPATHPHPRDASVVTMLGHSVLVTLIRVHFDPVARSHIVSGSRDGTVRIYNMLGECVRELDTHPRHADDRRRRSAAGGRSSSGFDDMDDPEAQAARIWESVHGWRREMVVRDVAWHPHLPLIMSTSWSANGGAILRHTYEGAPDASAP